VRVVEAGVPGVLVVEPRVYRDARGFFVETYHAARFAEAGIDAVFVQDNQSSSVRHTLRGLHLQRRRPQGKLVRVIQGEIWDVAVDVRPASPTFGRWTGTTLSADNFLQLWVPPGFAHGFCVMSDTAQVEYKCTAHYDPADELGIAYDDPELGIAWPVKVPLLSERDTRHPRLADVRRLLESADD